MDNDHKQSMKDHDLLIEVKTELSAVRADIKEMKDGIIQRVKSVEDNKIDRHEIDLLEQKNKQEHDFNTTEHQKFVNKDEFEPIKKLAYGAVALTLTILLSEILYLVINHAK